MEYDTMYNLLVAYKKREGHCNVPILHMEDGIQLGFWLTKQRQLKMKGTLDPEKVTQLDELGIIWYDLTDKWQSTYGLKVFKREGHCNLLNMWRMELNWVVG